MIIFSIQNSVPGLWTFTSDSIRRRALQRLIFEAENVRWDALLKRVYVRSRDIFRVNWRNISIRCVLGAKWDFGSRELVEKWKALRVKLKTLAKNQYPCGEWLRSGQLQLSTKGRIERGLDDFIYVALWLVEMWTMRVRLPAMDEPAGNRSESFVALYDLTVSIW